MAVPANAAPVVTLDHFLCYTAAASPVVGVPQFPGKPGAVEIRNQFGKFYAVVTALNEHCNPTAKDGGPNHLAEVTNPDAHLVCWAIRPNVTAAGGEPKHPNVQVQNQFGSAVLALGLPNTLCVPSWKNEQTPEFPATSTPPGLDHFVCYPAKYIPELPRFRSKPPSVVLKDQFGTITTKVAGPNRLCVPSIKMTHPDDQPTLVNPTGHLVCFGIDTVEVARTPFVKNQFGIGSLQTKTTRRVCLPSTKQVLPAG
jgi:hypothetical protein